MTPYMNIQELANSLTEAQAQELIKLLQQRFPQTQNFPNSEELSERVVKLAEKREKPISASEVKQSVRQARTVKPDAIREVFRGLANSGRGSLVGTGSKTRFTLSNPQGLKALLKIDKPVELSTVKPVEKIWPPKPNDELGDADPWRMWDDCRALNRDVISPSWDGDLDNLFRYMNYANRETKSGIEMKYQPGIFWKTYENQKINAPFYLVLPDGTAVNIQGDVIDPKKLETTVVASVEPKTDYYGDPWKRDQLLDKLNSYRLVGDEAKAKVDDWNQKTTIEKIQCDAGYYF